MHKSLNTSLVGKAAIDHLHDDRYYSKNEIDLGLATKSDINHNHDDIYSLINHTHESLTDSTGTDVLKSYLKRTGGSMTGKLRISMANGVAFTEYNNSFLNLISPTSKYSWARPSISFQCEGFVACILYLDTDGSIRIIWNDGQTKTIISK